MFDIQLFEDSARDNGSHYWMAHEFMEALGYESWPSFRAVVLKAQAFCLQQGIDTDDAFVPVALEDGGKSWKLSRFACFLIAMQADAKKPEVAAAQAALAKIAELLIEEKLASSGIARIEERGQLTEAEKHLSGVAKSAGVRSEQFGIFKDAGFRGMYDMPLKRLREYKGAPEGKTLYDFMGLTELAANTFRVTQTAERIRRNGARGLDATSRTAHEVGREVRDVMVRSSGVAPEDLALEEHIDKVKRSIRTTHKKMKKLDQVKKKK